MWLSKGCPQKRERCRDDHPRARLLDQSRKSVRGTTEPRLFLEIAPGLQKRDEMIAAIYARKAMEQNGVADETR